MRRQSLPLVLALALVACGSNGGSDRSASDSTSGSSSVPLLTTSPGPATTSTGTPGLTFTVTDLRLANSEESDNGFRILLDTPAADIGVTLNGVPSPNRVVRVCPAAELERRLPATSCETPAAGQEVRVPLTAANRGVEIVQVGVSNTGPAGNATVLSEIALRFDSPSREIQMRLPPLVPGEAGRRPTFRLAPPVGGAYRAAINWTPRGGDTGTAELALANGNANSTQAQGGPGTQISGVVPLPVDSRLTLRNTGSTTILGATLVATLP